MSEQSARSGRPRAPGVETAILRAAHDRLVSHGYARLTIGDAAADAGVSRPTVYRRWAGKQELVVDAIDHAFRERRGELAAIDMTSMAPREVVIEAVRRLFGRTEDGRGARTVAKVLAEADLTPKLLDIFREHALRPRIALFTETLRELQEQQRIRPDIDLDTIADMCLGGYLSHFLATGTDDEQTSARLASRVVAALWPCLRPE